MCVWGSIDDVRGIFSTPTNGDAYDDAYKYQGSTLIHRRKNNIGKTIKVHLLVSLADTFCMV